MSVRYIADSSADIRKIPGVDFVSVPLTISTAERDFLDDENLNVSEMLTYMEEYKGRSFTACPSSASWMEKFEGADELYVLALTSGLSGTYDSAKIAADMYQEEHPECKIVVVDTLTTGPEMRLLMEKIIEWKEEEKLSFEEICDSIQEYLFSTRLFFAFKSLHNLAQNGRVNKLAASAIGMLGISILGTASEKGTIETTAKCRGEKSVLKELFRQMEEAGYKGGKVRITHAENEKLAKHLAVVIREKYEHADIIVSTMKGLTGFYGERGGVIVACECV